MKYLRLSSAAVMLWALAGCSVQSSQLSTVMGILPGPSQDMSENTWTLEYGDYQAAVYAVNAPDAVMFSNTLGDHLVFDGWVITDATILNKARFKMTLVTAATGERQYISDTIVTQIHQCSPWQRQGDGGEVVFVQSCKGLNTYTNTILVNSEEAITEINHSIDGRSSNLRLIKS